MYTYAPVGLGVIDCSRRWIRVNKVMAEYFGKLPADFIGRSVHETLPTIADQFDRHLRQSIEAKKPFLNGEVSGECPITQGSIRTWSTSFYPLIDAQDNIVGINVVTEDITEDRRATEEHRAHRSILDMVSLQEPLELVFNTLTDAVEGIFPGAISYILHDHDGAALIAPLPRAAHSITQAIFSPPLTSEELKPISDVVDTRTELLIHEVMWGFWRGSVKLGCAHVGLNRSFCRMEACGALVRFIIQLSDRIQRRGSVIILRCSLSWPRQ